MLMHESNSFNPALTPIEDFRIEDRNLDTWSRSNTELAGFLAGAAASGLTPVPLLNASATPSGPVQADAYNLFGLS